MTHSNGVSTSPGRRITTREATVHTATIQVKTLTLDKRQVTLAVFRQLKSADLVVPESAELRGVPWGEVTYHPDACRAVARHLHIVWQLGDELRRANVPYAWPLEQAASARLAKAYAKATDAVILGAVVLATAPNPNGQSRGLTFEEKPGTTPYVGNPLIDAASRGSLLWVEYGGDRWPMAQYRSLYSTTEQLLPWSLVAWLNRRKGESETAYSARIQQGPPSKSREERELVAEIAERRRTDMTPREQMAEALGPAAVAKHALDEGNAMWRRQYETLEQLDHLFIAV